MDQNSGPALAGRGDEDRRGDPALAVAAGRYRCGHRLRSGQFSIPLARAVAPGGKLIAEDIHPGLLTHVELRAKESRVTNLQTVRGEVDDPKLPELVDVAFFHDVLHHIEHRAVFLQSLAKYIKPDGRLAIIDIDKDHPRASHKDDPV